MNIQMNEPHGIGICDIQLDYYVIFFYLTPFIIPNFPLNPWAGNMMLLMNILLQHMSNTNCHSFFISNVLEPVILLSFSIIGGHVEVTCCFKFKVKWILSSW
jgi:hypothetical protein